MIARYPAVEIKPKYIQGRFKEEIEYARLVRIFCRENGMVFQAHSVLKKNEKILESKLLSEVSPLPFSLSSIVSLVNLLR